MLSGSAPQFFAYKYVTEQMGNKQLFPNSKGFRAVVSGNPMRTRKVFIDSAAKSGANPLLTLSSLPLPSPRRLAGIVQCNV